MSMYYAMIDGEQRGPFPLDSLSQEGVRPDTYVWTKGMDDWEMAGDVPDICRMFRNRLHDLMHPSSAIVPIQADSGKDTTQSDLRPRSSLDALAQKEGQQLPTLEEMDASRNLDIPPSPLTGWALLSVIVFFPLGFPALVYAKRTKKLWKSAMENPENQNLKREAHDTLATARMWTGIAFFIGLIFWATLLFRN